MDVNISEKTKDIGATAALIFTKQCGCGTDISGTDISDFIYLCCDVLLT